jgi:hypothetical protein
VSHALRKLPDRFKTLFELNFYPTGANPDNSSSKLKRPPQSNEAQQLSAPVSSINWISHTDLQLAAMVCKLKLYCFPA